MHHSKLLLIADDPWLEPYEADINQRYAYCKSRLREIEKNCESLKNFASSYTHLGFNYDAKRELWTYREWAPEAHQLTLVGSFDDWGEGLKMKKGKEGIWQVDIPAELKFGHRTRVKVRITGKDGNTLDRIPAFINYAIQDPKTYDFCGVIWKPEKSFKWTDKSFDTSAIRQPMIYEAHVGMAQEKEGVGSYREFADVILPRIKNLNYNAIQLMAIKEHPYYGSFGYHVSNFFAPSSRFGTPDDLKYLVDKAHNSGLAVIMDAVYSHAVKNIAPVFSRRRKRLP